MRLAFRALSDPAFNRLHLRRRERAELGLRLRHYFIAILARDPNHHIALLRFAGNDRTNAVPLFQRFLANVESQSGIALLFVRTVTRKTFVREDRTDVAIEAELLHRA